MSFNWANVSSALSGVTSTLTSLGITGASATSIINSIGNASNPNLSDELAICKQILQFSTNPQILSTLAAKLATEQGEPSDAAALAMTLINPAPGTNIVQTVLEIEQLINSGG